MTTPLPHDAVAETLLIPLYMRACESKEVAPILYDPNAMALVAELQPHYDFSRFDTKPASRVGTALRARLFDDKAPSLLIAILMA